MTAIRFDGVSFGYRVGDDRVIPGSEAAPAPTVVGLDDVSMALEPGSATLLTGPSGCGKSTALRLMNGLIPHVLDGHLNGQVLVDGADVARTPVEEIGRRTATVFQNPRNQFFAGTVAEELAFARQQAGEPREQILAAVEAAAARIGIADWLHRPLWDMSGGELQAVACAAALAGQGSIYLFDEPTSNLSERAIAALAQIMQEMKASGATLVIAEHRLWFLRGIVDTVLTMQAGRVERTWSAEEFFSCADEQRRAAGWRTLHRPQLNGSTRPVTSPNGHPGLRLNEVRYSYGPRRVLDIDSLSFPAGQVSVLVGDNGAGKSTLCRLVTGLITPEKGGTISWNGTELNDQQRRATSSLVMQDVNRQLFSESVRREVTIGTLAEGVDPEALLAQLDLDEHADRHPMSLSGGQQQRLVIAAALAANSRVVVFDEPTSGVDYRHMRSISALIRALAARGVAVIVVTHDTEFTQACADQLVRLRAPRAGQPSDIEISTVSRAPS
jgi:energy-coupling factor transport system ATP-binding protein